MEARRKENDRRGLAGLVLKPGAGARLFLILLVLLAIVLIPFALLEAESEAFAAALLDAVRSRFAAFAVVVLLLAADILFPVPSSLVMVGAAILLPAALAFLANFVGLSAGCALGYVLGRRIGSPLIRAAAGEQTLRILDGWFSRYGQAALVLCRPVPVVAEMSVMLAGAARVGPLRFAGWTGAANIGVAGVYALLGAQVTGAFSFLLVLGAACLVPALGWLALRLGK